METYMSVDEFLEKYYIALKRDSWNLGDYAVNWLYAKSSLSPEKFLEWYNNQDFVNSEWSQEVKDLYSELKKAMVAGTTDAKNFLYTIRVITAFHSNENISENELNNDVNVLLYAIKNGTIKNPENTYRLLQLMVNAVGRNTTTLKRELALHQLATPYDVQSWLSYYLEGPYAGYGGSYYEYKADGLSTPKFIGSVNDAKKKLNDLVAITKDKINAELSKPVPNIDTIKYLGVSVIPSIAQQIVAIVKYFAKRTRPELRDGQTQEDVAKAKAVADELAREFDINKILDVSNGNYVQQYADQAEIKLAEMRPQYEAMKQELDDLKPRLSSMTLRWDTEHQKVQELEDDKEKLLRENSNLMSTIDFLKGKIKLFLTAFKKRAEERELPIKKAKGLQEVVANDLEGALNIEQIERDLSAARKRQADIMRNSPVRI